MSNLQSSKLFLGLGRDGLPSHPLDLQGDLDDRVEARQRRRLDLTRDVETSRNDGADDERRRRKTAANHVGVDVVVDFLDALENMEKANETLGPLGKF